MPGAGTSLRPAETRKTGILVPALALAGFILLSVPWLWFALRFPETGWDFTQFYIAGHLPISEVHSRSAFTAFGQQRLAPLGIEYFPPYVRPAVFALLLKPLGMFDYWWALGVWAAVNYCGYLAALLFLHRWLQFPWPLVAACALYFPAMFGIITGQDIAVYTVVFLCAAYALTKDRELAAGFLFAVCTYKFNLVFVVPLVFLAHRKYRGLAAFAAGVALILGASFAVAPASQYLETLRTISAQTIGFVPAGLRGVVEPMGGTVAYAVLALGILVACAFLIRRLNVLDGLCVAVTAGLLCAYHVTWYDYTLLVFPIAAVWTRAGMPGKWVCLLLLEFVPMWILWRQPAQLAATALILLQFAVFAALQPSPATAKAQGSGGVQG